MLIQRHPARCGIADGGAIWLDLIDPTPDEVHQVEQACALVLPTREDLGSIEVSSRIDVVDGVLRLGVPYFSHSDATAQSPVGFLLLPQRVITLRYAVSPAFELAAARIEEAHALTAAQALLTIIEAIVATSADRLEHVSAETGQLSSRIFGHAPEPGTTLRQALAELGHLEGRLTRMRQSATGLQRVVLFLRDCHSHGFDHALHQRAAAIGKDLEVLAEFDSQLTDKLQFLLDAVLGFINIEQNEVIKILTTVSVVSIPPMVLAGIWGMNFHNMPELHWPFGYAAALAVIALSALLPLAWLRRRGWV